MGVYLDITTVLGVEVSNTKESGSLVSEAEDTKGTGAGVQRGDRSRAVSWRLLMHSPFRCRPCFRSGRLPSSSSSVITSVPNYFYLPEIPISSKLYP